MMHPMCLLVNVTSLAMSALTLTAGLQAQYLGADVLAWQLWLIGVVPNWLILVVTIVRSLIRRQAGVDVLAMISISFALLSGEMLIVAVIALTPATGRALEDFVQARAQREMTALFDHAPKWVSRFADEQWRQVGLGRAQASDRLLVRHGEAVPAGNTLSGSADLDESALTGGSLTRHRLTADAVCNGVLDVGAAFEMIASTSAEKGTFAGVIRLVSATQSKHSPSVRLAGQYTFVSGGVVVLLAEASWILTGDSTHCLAVLAVATPCPLILAVSAAIVSGLSRCAKRGVLVRGGGALERLALADTLFFDKTGMSTGGFARPVDVECAPHCTSGVVLDLAGSTAQTSSHVTVGAVAKATREQGAESQLPSGVVRNPGAGVCGRVDGYVISIGSLPYVLGSSTGPSWVEAFAERVSYAGTSAVFVGVSSELAGTLQLIDRVRLEAPHTLRLLRREGVEQQAMLAGDRANVAESIGSVLRVTEVHAALSPTTKLAVIRGARADGKVIMVGDGVNDTPALTTADIGMAMGARGAAASSETADIVLLVDRPGRLVDAVRIAHRTRSAALQSVIVDMSLPLAAMVVAALGHLPPLAGVTLQELIDVLAIASTLRALLPTPDEATRSLVYTDVERLEAKHAESKPVLNRIRLVADALSHMGGGAAKGALLSLNQSLTDILVPHERRDDTQLYPDVVRLLGEDDPMTTVSTMHREVFHATNLLSRIVADISASGPDAAVTRELQRLLYGLDAILRPHYTQEGELFHMLGGEA